MEISHKIAVEVWNNFIAQTNNDCINFSFKNLEDKIDTIIKSELNHILNMEIKECKNENLKDFTKGFNYALMRVISELEN